MLLMISFVLIDLVGVWTVFSGSLEVGCPAWANQFGVASIVTQEQRDVCEWFVDTELCFYSYLEVLKSFIGALPGMIYIAMVEPHDCFDCLSVMPEMRITDFQLTAAETLRREYHVKHGGICSCFPTFSRKLRFQRLISFERKMKVTAIQDGDSGA